MFGRVSQIASGAIARPTDCRRCIRSCDRQTIAGSAAPAIAMRERHFAGAGSSLPRAWSPTHSWAQDVNL